MDTTTIRDTIKTWAKSHKRHLIAALVLLVLGFAAGSVLAHDKPAPAPTPAPQPTPPRIDLDPWNGTDKLFHLGAGMMAGALATVHTESRLKGGSIACGAGVLFEVVSPAWGGYRSMRDAAAGCLGAVVGAFIGGLQIAPAPRGARVAWFKEF